MYLDITWIRILTFEFISKFLKKLKLIYPKKNNLLITNIIHTTWK